MANINAPLEGHEKAALDQVLDALITEAEKPIEALAQAEGLSFGEAAALHAERAQAAAAPTPEVSNSTAPWLDTSELIDPPRPWSDEDWERDSRRAEAADVVLTRDLWRSYAEMGLDAIWELQRELDDAQARQASNYRATQEEVARQRRAHRLDVEKELDRRRHAEAGDLTALSASPRAPIIGPDPYR